MACCASCSAVNAVIASGVDWSEVSPVLVAVTMTSCSSPALLCCASPGAGRNASTAPTISADPLISTRELRFMALTPLLPGRPPAVRVFAALRSLQFTQYPFPAGWIQPYSYKKWKRVRIGSQSRAERGPGGRASRRPASGVVVLDHVAHRLRVVDEHDGLNAARAGIEIENVGAIERHP